MTNEQLLFAARFAIPLVGGIVASVIDQRERRIPNWLTVPLFAGGILFRGITGGWSGLGDAAAGFALGFALLFLLWITGGGGGGDVKFMAAVGAWLGPYHLLFVFVLSAFFLGFIAAGLLLLRLVRGKPPSVARDENEQAKEKVPRGIPYALPATLAIGLRLAWMLLIGRTS